MKFLVVSSDSSEDRLFLDYVVAPSREEAHEFIADVRGRLTDGHLTMDQYGGCVFTLKELQRMAKTMDSLTPDAIKVVMDALKKEAGDGEG